MRDGHRQAGERNHLFDQIANAIFNPGTNVVNFAPCAFFRQRQIRVEHIADIGEIPGDVQIAGFQHGRTLAALDGDQLLGHGGQDKLGALTTADMVESARHDNAVAAVQAVLHAPGLRRRLAGRVRVARAQGLGFSNRQTGRGRQPIHIA